ncbi:hypothetical protein NNC19_07250 [Clostridium sp. SHJSY1]|uniref:hypothetical protein n=1 Tax=Clostridium sp. SHJSY1 TaxID=2942483 RepID=UPI002875F863|nr:hypothetical protein [Clostridium sp. SHJSY1]MDS0525470.1 hypothetical protein [Clostridium sp. SHJSY1]
MSNENEWANNIGKMINTDIIKNIDPAQNSINFMGGFNRGGIDFDKVSQDIAKNNREKREREILNTELNKRNTEINEERLMLDHFKVFLLQSVNRDQKEVLEKIDSLIDTIELGGKVTEANLAIIEKELSDIKQAAGNLNENFIKLIQKKMIEMGVEAAIKYFFVGIKMLFLIP